MAIYRNHFRWRVMPPDGADQVGLFDKSFSSKEEATEYQKRVKAQFPTEPCCLVDTGLFYNSDGRAFPTRRDAEQWEQAHRPAREPAWIE